jgi:GAF domain-containing protein
MTGLLLGWRASIVITVASILSGFGLAYAEESGLIDTVSYPPTAFAQDMTFIFGLNTVLLYLLINGLENEIKKSKVNLSELELSNTKLNSAQTDLEKRTIELKQRGLELETANTQIQRRATQFEAITQVTQTITAIRDLQALLPRVTTVISEKFGFYHVGIFLLDEINQYAILSAANSAGGKKMLERKHRLRVGEEGIVGYAAATGKPRIAMDVGTDAVFFNNPDLPDTHSEMALPLISKNIIIGALDVQSTQVGAFTDDDIQMLSLLADQVSLAIENARIFDESRKALAESEMVSRQVTRENWGRLPEQQKLLGYRYNITGASPLKEFVKIAESGSNKSKGKQTEAIQAVVPIELRGETIGTLVVQSPSGSQWNEDQLDLIRAVADRVALSAENARLFEETTARAEREKLVSDITSKIRSHTDPQSMIQTAIDELRGALGASRVEVIPQSIKSTEKNEA